MAVLSKKRRGPGRPKSSTTLELEDLLWNEQRVFIAWLKARTRKADRDSKTATAALFQDYQDWLLNYGSKADLEYAFSDPIRFGNALSNAGYGRRKTGGHAVRTGILLKPDPATESGRVSA